MSIAFSSALSMFWYPGNLSEIWVLLLGLYIPDPAVLPSIWPSEFLDGGMNDPSVYMHCCGWYLRGCCVVNVFGKGIDVGVLVCGSVGFGCIFPCVREFNVVVCGCGFDGVGVYVCVMCCVWSMSV